MVMSETRTDIDLLARSAEKLLLAATDERRLLDVAAELLGGEYGYGARYVLLHDDVRGELYAGGAAGPFSDTEVVRGYRVKDDVGLAGASWSGITVVNVPDVSVDPRYVNVVASCRSEICVPIVGGEKVLGVLSVESDRVNAFDADDERLLAAYARVLAMALLHARIHQARQKDMAELQALSEVARRAAELDLQGTLDSVTEAVRRLTTSDSVAIYLWDVRHGRLEPAALSFDGELFPAAYAEIVRSTPIVLGQGITGWVAEHREAVYVDDVARDGRAVALADVSLEQRSALVLPMIVEDRLVGVVRAIKAGVGAYTADHFRFAQTIVLQATMAIAAAEAHEEVRRLSLTDELTGAHNVRHVLQRLREEVEFAKRHQESVSMLVIDGDAMKTVNDEHGHAEGNRLLVELTSAMRSSLRLSDVLGRFGGDEFIVVLPRTGPRDALIAAERLRVAVASREFRDAKGEVVRATVSVGVASFPENADSADGLFREADRALYAAKQSGRDRVAVAGRIA